MNNQQTFRETRTLQLSINRFWSNNSALAFLRSNATGDLAFPFGLIPRLRMLASDPSNSIEASRLERMAFGLQGRC